MAVEDIAGTETTNKWLHGTAGQWNADDFIHQNDPRFAVCA